MSKTLYVKLKDTGTVFHDITSGSTVVADKIGRVANTPKVQQALRDNVLVLCEDQKAAFKQYLNENPEAKEAYEKVQAAKKEAAEAGEGSEETETEEAEETEAEDAPTRRKGKK